MATNHVAPEHIAISVNRLHEVNARIERALSEFSRPSGSVHLLAVSKTFPLQAIDEVAALGQKAFGENYAQEGINKASARPELEWHFIGPIQSNKTRGIANHFNWVHTIDRLKIAERLSSQRPAHLPPLQVCVQVNISGESSKSGCLPQEALALCNKIEQLPHLQLRGLMAIPESHNDPELQRKAFHDLRQLFTQINSQGLTLDTLSMGMSNDLEAAIAEGATLVRVGAAIFGQRPTP